MGSGVTWWHRGGTWCWHPFGDTRMAFSTWGHDVELGICISLVAQGWHKGGTRVALSWSSQQHPAAGLAPVEMEKSCWWLRHHLPCLPSFIPFFNPSLQHYTLAEAALGREALHALGHRGCCSVPAGRSSSGMCFQVKSKSLHGALGAALAGLFSSCLGVELVSLGALNSKP